MQWTSMRNGVGLHEVGHEVLDAVLEWVSLASLCGPVVGAVWHYISGSDLARGCGIGRCFNRLSGFTVTPMTRASWRDDRV